MTSRRSEIDVVESTSHSCYWLLAAVNLIFRYLAAPCFWSRSSSSEPPSSQPINKAGALSRKMEGAPHPAQWNYVFILYARLFWRSSKIYLSACSMLSHVSRQDQNILHSALNHHHVEPAHLRSISSLKCRGAHPSILYCIRNSFVHSDCIRLSSVSPTS